MIKILTVPHTEFAARHMAGQLKKLGLEADIFTFVKLKDNSLYIIYQANHLTHLPKNYIIMQTEIGMSHWFSEGYLQVLKKAIAVWDYSEINQVRYQNRHMCIVTPGINPQAEVEKDIPNLFYGWLEGSERRQRIVKNLSEQVNLMVVTNKLQSDMWRILSRTETVYNIHYHESSPLELYRICESLSHGCRVLTEHGDTFKRVTMEDNFEEIKKALKESRI